MPSTSSSSGRTAREALTVFSGNIAATGLGFAANICVMRALGPEGFGVVIVATTVLSALWQVAGRGWDQALVRGVSQQAGEAPGGRAEVIGGVHRLKLLLGAALLTVGLLTARPVTDLFVGQGASVWPVALGAVGAVAASLWGLGGAVLQSDRRFAAFSVLQVINAATRLAITLAFLILGSLTPASAMGATVAGYVLGGAAGYALAPAARAVTVRAPAYRTIVASARWLVISSLIHLFYSRMDQLLLAGLCGSAAAGVYGAAATFIQMIDLLNVSLLTVVLPATCEQTDRAALRRHAWRTFRVAMIFALPLLPAVMLAGPIMGPLLGVRYEAAVPLFKVIFFGAVVTLVTHPLQAILHARGRTHLLTVLDVGLLIANGVCTYVAIGAHGVVGAAWVAMLTRVASGVALVLLVVRELAGARVGRGPALDAGD